MFKKILLSILISFYSFAAPISFAETSYEETDTDRTNLIPLMERYILDELKAIRTEMLENKAELIEKVVDKEIKIAEQAMTYSTNTVTYFFYIITGVGIILAIIGWNSIRDMKSSLHDIADKEARRITQEYESRMTSIEKELREKSAEILKNQQDIERSQKVQFLWWQADTEQDDMKKILLYNQIIELKPEATEAYVRLSSAQLHLSNFQDAIHSTTKALEITGDNSIALYNRAVAHTQIGKNQEAIQDLKNAFNLSETLKAHANEDALLSQLHSKKEYKDLFK